MSFKQWIEHYGGQIPEQGDWVIVKQNIPAGAIGAITLPAATYIVIATSDKTYTLKNPKTSKLYQVYTSDLDDMIKNNMVEAD